MSHELAIDLLLEEIYIITLRLEVIDARLEKATTCENVEDRAYREIACMNQQARCFDRINTLTESIHALRKCDV